tara:strand:+ start:1530 stop:1943 length:414 start_codon:yes stop_codon:yes gene_type:complete
MERNNKEIKRRFREQMTWAGEQLVSCRDIESFELRDAIVNKSTNFASERLDDGKVKYLHQVPITLQECLDANRNNLAETIEEVIDALIYIIAEEILQTELKCDIASRYLKKANAYLYYALYFLMVADMHDKKGKENE